MGCNANHCRAVDSPCIKVEGEGEWQARKHGGPKRRVWRKIPLGIDEQTLELRAVEVTGSHIGDAPVLPGLLSQKRGPASIKIPRSCNLAKLERIPPPKPRRNKDARHETAGPTSHGAGLRPTDRGGPDPLRRHERLHCVWQTCHRNRGMNPSGERETSDISGFAQLSQSLLMATATPRDTSRTARPVFNRAGWHTDLTSGDIGRGVPCRECFLSVVTDYRGFAATGCNGEKMRVAEWSEMNDVALLGTESSASPDLVFTRVIAGSPDLNLIFTSVVAGRVRSATAAISRCNYLTSFVVRSTRRRAWWATDLRPVSSSSPGCAENP